MKAEEIMIGDWVRLRYREFGSGNLIDRTFQVSQIRKGSFNEIEIWSEQRGNAGRIEGIEPIPITHEILERNAIDFVFKTRNKRFYLEFHAEAGMIMLYVYNNDSFHETGVSFKYVHELQHALKLFRINKTIEL